MLRRGFSLLELLVVLFIFSILLTYAYPNYQLYLIRTHRLEGQLGVLDLANRMEQYFAKYHTYTQASIGTGNEHDVLNNAYTLQKYYLLRIHSATDKHYIVQAVPQKQQGQIDALCQILQMDDLGLQTVVAGPEGSPLGTEQECWGG